MDKYYPLRKLTRKEFKQTLKPWIATGVLNSIKRKDQLFNRYVNCKDYTTKTNIHVEYKALKNRITSLIFLSKKNYNTPPSQGSGRKAPRKSGNASSGSLGQRKTYR